MAKAELLLQTYLTSATMAEVASRLSMTPGATAVAVSRLRKLLRAQGVVLPALEGKNQRRPSIDYSRLAALIERHRAGKRVERLTGVPPVPEQLPRINDIPEEIRALNAKIEAAEKELRKLEKL